MGKADRSTGSRSCRLEYVGAADEMRRDFNIATTQNRGGADRSDAAKGCAGEEDIRKGGAYARCVDRRAAGGTAAGGIANGGVVAHGVTAGGVVASGIAVDLRVIGGKVAGEITAGEVTAGDGAVRGV